MGVKRPLYSFLYPAFEYDSLLQRTAGFDFACRAIQIVSKKVFTISRFRCFTEPFASLGIIPFRWVGDIPQSDGGIAVGTHIKGTLGFVVDGTGDVIDVIGNAAWGCFIGDQQGVVRFEVLWRAL